MNFSGVTGQIGSGNFKGTLINERFITHKQAFSIWMTTPRAVYTSSWDHSSRAPYLILTVSITDWVSVFGAAETPPPPLTSHFSRKPAELKDLAPGTNPPFLLYNGTLKTDFIKIEEFLEQTLAPPRYCCVHPFHKYQRSLILMMVYSVLPNSSALKVSSSQPSKQRVLWRGRWYFCKVLCLHQKQSEQCW